MENMHKQIYRFTDNPNLVKKKIVKTTDLDNFSTKNSINQEYTANSIINSLLPLFQDKTIDCCRKYEINLNKNVVKYVFPVNKSSNLYSNYYVNSIVLEFEKKDIYLYQNFVNKLDTVVKERVTSAHKNSLNLKKAVAIAATAAIAISAIALVTYEFVKGSKGLETNENTSSLIFDDEKSISQQYAQNYQNYQNFEAAKKEIEAQEKQQAEEEYKRHVKTLSGY